MPSRTARSAPAPAGPPAPDPDDAPPAVPPAARRAILAWYRERGRPLAFRRTRDPYAILVSEAMAQQTQAARAAEAWERFMERFPTVGSLAAAPLSDALRQWAGLGYDRRARALWQAAGLIVERHGGEVPSAIDELEALPGVGPYTARAVAALAHGRRVGAVDVNVRRVLGRVLFGDASSVAAGALQRSADASVPAADPGGWTHALMDLGATVCKPRNPRCGECPALAWCRYAAVPTQRAQSATRTVARTVALERAVPFHATNRWLRGRIMDRLRATDGSGWTVVAGPLGMHDAAAVATALAGLERDGLVERDRRGRARLRRA
ncbi:MAG: A/G-specific adenine glycosylase [Candidatus Limnocylindria bacterium]